MGDAGFKWSLSDIERERARVCEAAAEGTKREERNCVIVPGSEGRGWDKREKGDGVVEESEEGGRGRTRNGERRGGLGRREGTKQRQGNKEGSDGPVLVHFPVVSHKPVPVLYVCTPARAHILNLNNDAERDFKVE
jgi:hypothetical protein